jgi:4-hydroxybenzoate polyprenyltransferase
MIAAVLGGGTNLDWRLPVLLVANMLGFGFAFMINEVEDAQDDAKDLSREIKNPVARGEISYSNGWYLSIGVGLLSVIFYAALGGWVFVLGVVNFFLSLTYSWRLVRLKSLPIVDLVSHSLMLGGLQFLAGYAVYGAPLSLALMIVSLILLVSIHGQLHNQLRDFESDREAGLRNSAYVLGKAWTNRLRAMIVLLVVLAGGVSLFKGVVPVYVMVLALLFSGMLYMLKVNFLFGLRSGEKAGGMTSVLSNLSLVANLVVLSWFGVEIVQRSGFVMGILENGRVAPLLEYAKYLSLAERVREII